MWPLTPIHRALGTKIGQKWRFWSKMGNFGVKMWVYLAYIGLLPWTSTSCNIIRSSIGSHGHKSCQNDWNVDFWPKKAPISHVWGCGDGREKFLWVKWVVSGVREIQRRLTLAIPGNSLGPNFFYRRSSKKTRSTIKAAQTLKIW